MLRVQDHAIDVSIYYDCQEGHDREVEDVFYDCREPSEKRHPISDTGDISPSRRTSPCLHMWRTMRTMHVPLFQSNRYTNWVRCPLCGHTHATITYSATCCLTCKEKYNRMMNELKCQRHQQWLTQPTQPPMEAVDVTRNCPWTKWGMLVSPYIFRMTPHIFKWSNQGTRRT